MDKERLLVEVDELGGAGGTVKIIEIPWNMLLFLGEANWDI